MSKRKRELTGEEKKLWRRVAETTRTRKPLPIVDDESEPAPPSRVKLQLGPSASRPSAKPKSGAPAVPPANRGGEKRVRRGQVEIGASLDLHGHTQVTARAALVRFLRTAYARGDRTVIVVTGVGRAGQGVLKRLVPEWLAERDIRAIIAGYAQAHRAHGGAGAFYVFLKRVVQD